MGPPARASLRSDAFRQLGVDPLKESFNRPLLDEFITEMGKIKGRAKTQLTWWSQRKVGKAVRRARNMGIIPMFCRSGAMQIGEREMRHITLRKE